jgi:hypothetical protein
MNAELPKPRQWNALALVPGFAGIYWLTAAPGNWLLWGLIPGAMLLASGFSQLVWPGDARITQFISAGGLLGLILSIPAMFVDTTAGLIAALLSAVAYVIGGRISLTDAPRRAGVPELELSPKVCAKAATDEALMAYFVNGIDMPSGELADTSCEDALRLHGEFTQGGHYDDLVSLHAAPPAPEDARLLPGRLMTRRYQMLRFSSGFALNERFPRAAQWSSHRPNQECHAVVLRHDEPRPWLLCIHGYRMGYPWMDLGLFRPEWLHERLGLNMVVPTLPLHGPRRIGWRSGDRYMDGDPLGFIYAQMQALWDLRRTVAWIRAQDPNARIGVLGFSLGGYNTALLATYESGLDFAVAGIPLVDLASVLWRHIPPAHRDYYECRGFDLAMGRKLLTAVSPLARAPLIDVERRAIFAGIADRVVPPEHPLKLSAHWGVPVEWFPGGHLTFAGEGAVHRALETPMLRAGWQIRR